MKGETAETATNEQYTRSVQETRFDKPQRAIDTALSVYESATYEGKEAILPTPQIPSSTNRPMNGKAIVRREAT